MLTAVAVLAAGLIADGSVRVEGRAGTTVGGQDPSSAGVSADLTARAPGPDGAFRFGISPSSVLASEGSQLFARGFAEADWRLRAGAWVRLRQGLGYGSIDLSPVAPGAVVGPFAHLGPGAHIAEGVMTGAFYTASAEDGGA